MDATIFIFQMGKIGSLSLIAFPMSVATRNNTLNIIYMAMTNALHNINPAPPARRQETRAPRQGEPRPGGPANHLSLSGIK